MKCVQCGRERKIGMARTEKFCTQRCIINWLEAHPDKGVEDAMGESSPEAPLSISNVQSLSSPAKGESEKDNGAKAKPVSRALKNLQIDMALPGTKLPQQEDSDEEGRDSSEGRTRKRPRISTPSQFQQSQLPRAGTRSTRRGAQVHASPPTKPVKVTSTPIAAAKTGTGGGGKKSAQSLAAQPGTSGKAIATAFAKSTPTSSGGNIKRLLSASAPHPPALKKAKTGAGGTPSKPSSSGSGPKAVTFNLGFVQSSQSQPTPTFSLVPIDQLSAPLGGTLVNQQDSPVSIPDGKELHNIA